MSEQRKSFLINLGVGAAIAALTYWFAASTDVEGGLVQKLCDAFFVAGVMITGSAGLAFVRNQGMFDIFSYSFRGLFGVRIPPWAGGDKQESFAEYKEKKKVKRKAPTGTLLAGLCYLVAALLCLAVYYV